MIPFLNIKRLLSRLRFATSSLRQFRRSNLEKGMRYFSAQKQPPRGVPRKKCSEIMQQIYRRTPMPKCDFNKVAKQLYWNQISVWVFSCKFAACFQFTFSQEHLSGCFCLLKKACTVLVWSVRICFIQWKQISFK